MHSVEIALWNEGTTISIPTKALNGTDLETCIKQELLNYVNARRLKNIIRAIY